MGVFARIFRRSKAAEEASTAEAQADTPTAEPAAEETAEAEASVEVNAEDADRSAPAESVEGESDDGVEIPKQQSADAAADSEAGEGART
ncbi:hypothetical protein IM697_34185 [Streptomyces ferrugineus]|uniref:Gliding motility protein n=1 Tax=Streptomyces ferrugineus TaxID=1413221 RepID=A0A7M2SI18_9ACTN|nr:hypothetical protein [Streptomyces ferrugineus]QOV35093.1 hypothetical protein IM697_34185 [Streptomyces ferrugineus]